MAFLNALRSCYRLTLCSWLLCLPMATVLLSPAQTAQAQNASQVKVYDVTPQSLRSVIARNKGKVVLVNFWATWCSPCVAELPALAQLAKNSKRDVVVLLVSADESSAKGQAQRVLAQRGHRSTYRIAGDLLPFFDKFDPAYKGAIALPISYVYDKQGRMVKRVVGKENTLAGFQKLLAPYRK